MDAFIPQEYDLSGMKISERGQITIPKRLRDRFGMNQKVEVEIVEASGGLLIRKCAGDVHPVDRITGILKGRALPGGVTSVDEYIEDIRGR